MQQEFSYAVLPSAYHRHYMYIGPTLISQVILKRTDVKVSILKKLLPFEASFECPDTSKRGISTFFNWLAI